MKTIRMKLDHIIVDRTAYKPYTSQLNADDIYVEIPIPDGEFKVEKDVTVLTVDGLATLMGNVATAIDKMQGKYVEDKFQGGRR